MNPKVLLIHCKVLNDPQKYEKITCRLPATCFLYYIIIRGSTFTTVFVNMTFWDKINFTETNVAYNCNSE